MNVTQRNEALESGARRKRATAKTPSISHLTPRPFLDPIRSVRRESIHWQRKVFHVIGIGAAGLGYLLTPVEPMQAFVIMGIFGALFVSLDLLRFKVPALNKKVKKDFGGLMRDYELDGLSGSSWFFLALAICFPLLPKLAAAIGIIYLALGDPLASFVGVRWGRTKLPGKKKSLEGSLALTVGCTIAGTVALGAVGGLAWGTALAVAGVSAIAAAVAEWLPTKLDDNFRVPILAGGACALLLMLV